MNQNKDTNKQLITTSNTFTHSWSQHQQSPQSAASQRYQTPARHQPNQSDQEQRQLSPVRPLWKLRSQLSSWAAEEPTRRNNSTNYKIKHKPCQTNAQSSTQSIAQTYHNYSNQEQLIKTKCNETRKQTYNNKAPNKTNNDTNTVAINPTSHQLHN